MKEPKDKQPELSDAELKKVAGGAGKKAIIRKRAKGVAVELTDAELQSASGGIGRRVTEKAFVVKKR